MPADDIAMRITTFRGETTPGNITVRSLTGLQRLRRSLGTLAVCWGLAVAAISLPLIHFVLVPALLLLGPFLAASTYRRQRVVGSVTGACPACRSTLTRFGRGCDPVGFAQSCPGCGTLLHVEPVGSHNSRAPV